MENISLLKRTKQKFKNPPPPLKFIFKGAGYGGFTGYTLSTLYTLPFSTFLFLGLAFLTLIDTYEAWYVRLEVIAAFFLGIWVGFFVLFAVPAYLFGVISGSITALILYFFYERIDLTPMRAILLTMGFWIPLGIVQSIAGVRALAEIGSEPLFQWLLFYIPNMIFLQGMMFVGYKLWKYSTTLEQIPILE